MRKSNLLMLLGGAIILAVGGYFLFRSGGSSDFSGLQDKKASSQLVGDISPPSINGSFKKGEKIPPVSFSGLNGNRYLLDDFSGKPIVIDFWAAWCPFCVSEMPELEKLQQKYPNEVVIIGVHRTDTEGAAAGFNFAKERGVTYLLGSDLDGSLYRAAGGFGMPVAIFIDPGGVVVEIKSGPKTGDEIAEKIEKLVEKK